MRRDMDLIRELLFKLETIGKPGMNFSIRCTDEEVQVDGYSHQDIAAHFEMLIDSGLVIGKVSGATLYFQRLSHEGHEFMAAVREKEVWEKTKAAAKKGGSETLQFMWDVAKSVAKKQLQDRTGLEF